MSVAEQRAHGKEPGPERPVRVTHVITGLDVGGAETALLRLATSVDRAQFPTSVLSLKPGGVLAARLRDAGVPVRAHPLAPQALPWALLGLAVAIRDSRADVVQ